MRFGSWKRLETVREVSAERRGLEDAFNLC
jgi:hypothetical protein